MATGREESFIIKSSTIKRKSSCALKWTLVLGNFFPLIRTANAILENRRFYPELGYEANTPYCEIPPFQEANSRLVIDPQYCTSRAAVTLLTHEELAKRYAPYLFFHPLEQYTMSSVNRTIQSNEGRIIRQEDGLPDSVFADNLDPENLVKTSRDPDEVMFSQNFVIEHDLYDEYLEGDGFDLKGLSKAPIYWNAFDVETGIEGGAVTINYYFYFPWSGPSSLGLVSSFQGVNEYTPFSQPPHAVHESDWESMSVTVCPWIEVKKEETNEPNIPVFITYRQNDNTFGQILDCRLGQCTFYRDTSHPVGFVALNTHDVHSQTATEIIFAEVNPLEFFANLQSVLVVHRTAYADSEGNFRYFAPDESNVVPLPDQNDIPENVTEDMYWAAYCGKWGRPDIGSADENLTAWGESTTYVNQTAQPPTCLSRSTTEFVDCPTEEENPVFYLLLQLMGTVEARRPLVKAATYVVEYLVKFFTVNDGTAPFGPAAKGFYQEPTLFEEVVPIWERINETGVGAEDYCQYIVDKIPDTYRLPVDVEYLPFVQNVVGVVFMFLFIILVTITFLLCMRRQLKPCLEVDQDGFLSKPERHTRRDAFYIFWLFLAAFIVTLLGGCFFFSGYFRISTILTDRFNIVDWRVINGFIICVSSFNLGVDILLLYSMWVVSEKFWLELNRKYYRVIGDTEMESSFEWLSKYKYKSPIGTKTYIWLSAMLMMGFMLSTMMVTLGVYNVGTSYMFGTTCRLYMESIDGVCLKAPGWDDIKCGRDFQEFCQEWARREMILTLWGGFIVLAGHFFMIIGATCEGLNLRHLRNELKSLPDNPEELEMFKKLHRNTARMVGDQASTSVLSKNAQEADADSSTIS